MEINKKIIVLLGDGMADYPIESLGGKTPLEAAETPNMDMLAQKGISGLVKTVPDGMFPGSDTANLSVFGYNPEKYYTGRAPLEAFNMGIELGPQDAAFRCNLVTIKDNIMKDFSADHIDSQLAETVMSELSAGINIPDIELYAGVSYRNLLVWRNYPYDRITDSTPPHDIQNRNTGQYFPTGEGADVLIKIMTDSEKIIKKSSRITDARSKFRGNPLSAWIWGGGRRPAMETLKKRFGLYGHTISAVDLIHGIGRAAGLTPIEVKDTTGYIDTNYEGKTEALLREIKNCNFIYLHVEAPDESGHEGSIENKIKAIEDFDKKIVGPVAKGMEEYEDYTILVMPDHPTPISIRTHSDDPVPFCIYNKKGWNSDLAKNKNAEAYSENAAQKTGLIIRKGHKLIELMIHGKLLD